MKIAKVLNYVCALLALVLLVMTFLPSWTVTIYEKADIEMDSATRAKLNKMPREEAVDAGLRVPVPTGVSIQRYLWFPNTNAEIAEYFVATRDGFEPPVAEMEDIDSRFSANQAALPALAVTILTLAALALCAFKSANFLSSVFAILSGAVTFWAFKTDFILTIAKNASTINILAIALILIGVVSACLLALHALHETIKADFVKMIRTKEGHKMIGMIVEDEMKSLKK